jgi:uncharacterized membrane protein (DUF373 family)
VQLKIRDSLVADVVRRHPVQRKYLEFTQDLIVFGLCLLLFITMGIKLIDLARALVGGTDFSRVIGEILFILVLLREVILRGALHIDWPQLLVVCAFILTLAAVLRFSGIRLHPKGGAVGVDHSHHSPQRTFQPAPLPAGGNEAK